MSFFRILRPSTRFAVCSQCRAYATKTATQSTGAQHLQTPEKTTKGSSPASTFLPDDKFRCNKQISIVSASIPQSSCPADTILPGLSYLKEKPPVLSLPDDQYPEWLWTILEPKLYPDDGPGGKAERVKRRRENKRKIKERNFMSTQ